MKIYTKICLHGIISLLFSISIRASVGTFPYSFENKLKSSVKTFELKSLNNDSILKKDSGCELCGGKFGIGFPENIDLQNSGTWDTLKSGDRVWRLKIASKTAVGLRINWDKFNIPQGSMLFITDGIKTIYKGPVTSPSNAKMVYTTGNLYVKELILEYDQPSSGEKNPEFHISECIYIYKNRQFKPECGLGGTPAPPAGSCYGTSLPCHTNVNCLPWVTDHCNDIRATIMYDFAFQNSDGNILWTECSGVLVNNTAQDFTPYILTANHCVSQTANDNNPRVELDQWIVYFNWQSPDCYDAYGNIVSTMVGVEIKATAACSPFCATTSLWYPDMALLLACYNPPSLPLQYNMYFAGWNRIYNSVDLDNTDVTIIGHPQGDIKKIFGGTVHDWYGDSTTAGCTLCPNDYHWWQVDHTGGDLTEPGNSGCPLFTVDHQVIGTCSWTAPLVTSCDHPGVAEFGCLGDFWNNVNSYLDPLETGAWNLQGIDPIEVCQSDITLEGNHWPASSWQQEPMITIQAGHTITANGGMIDPTYIQSYTPPGGPTYYSQYVYSAGDAIDLKSDFGVDIGNSFKAVIAGCQPWTSDCGFNYVSSPEPTGKNQNGNSILNDNSAAISPPPQNVLLTVDPNPFTNMITINFNIGFSANVSISISDIKGNQVKNIPLENYNPGTYSVQVPLGDLIPGTYYLKFFDGKTIQVEGIVKM